MRRVTVRRRVEDARLGKVTDDAPKPEERKLSRKERAAREAEVRTGGIKFKC